MLHRYRSRHRLTLSDFVWKTADDALFVERFNLANHRWRLPVRLEFSRSDDLFVVHSEDQSITVARRSRLPYYFRGCRFRENQLVDEYLLSRISFEKGDYAIDVGANIGEVSRLLHSRFGVTPIAFEPDMREFRALRANLVHSDGIALDHLLWSHASDLDFYDANDSGDSSVFPTPGAASVERRAATTLDASLSRAGLASVPIRLLKLEAEGAEPEILAGASDTLDRVQFVTADVGPERGISGETTLFPVIEILLEHGFRGIGAHTGRLVVLFERR